MNDKIHFVGRLNREIFKVVTEDILTDEVIITEEQIEHIKSQHPGDYENFGKFFRDIVEAPDYILEANKPYSALVLKSFNENGKIFKVVLRLKTSIDNPNYKNSIITFWKIDENTLKRLIKNKKVLYKRE
ncbi:MAG: hypothetical protein K2N56_08840 [Oscillospiraceae bacterium]|nr:hypothetical protein [Oscillospiraceae bacterium]